MKQYKRRSLVHRNYFFNANNKLKYCIPLSFDNYVYFCFCCTDVSRSIPFYYLMKTTFTATDLHLIIFFGNKYVHYTLFTNLLALSYTCGWTQIMFKFSTPIFIRQTVAFINFLNHVIINISKSFCVRTRVRHNKT